MKMLELSMNITHSSHSSLAVSPFISISSPEIKHQTYEGFNLKAFADLLLFSICSRMSLLDHDHHRQKAAAAAAASLNDECRVDNFRLHCVHCIDAAYFCGCRKFRGLCDGHTKLCKTDRELIES